MAKTRSRNVTQVDDLSISVKSKSIGRTKMPTIKLSRKNTSSNLETEAALQAQREVNKSYDVKTKTKLQKCVVRLGRVHIMDRTKGVSNQTSEKNNIARVVDVPGFSISKTKSNNGKKSQNVKTIDKSKPAIQLRNRCKQLSANEISRTVGVEAVLREQDAAVKSHSAIRKPKLQKCVVRLHRLSAINRSKNASDEDLTNKNQKSQSDTDERVVGVPIIAGSSKQPAISEKLWNVEINDKSNPNLDLQKPRKLNISVRSTSTLKMGINETFCDVTSFGPTRNSTICKLPETVGKQPELESHRTILDEDENGACTTLNGNFLQNLANKSQLINKVLLFDDHLSKIPEMVGENRKPQQKTRKYFFRKKRNVTEEHKVIRKTRHSSKSQNVYDFPSSSQNQDFEKHEDPAADIIKKMIKEGRVVVTTLMKGQGKPKVKQQRKVKKVRPMGKRRQCSLSDIVKQVENVANKNCPNVSEKDPPLSPVYEPEHEMAYDNQDVEEIAIGSRTQNDSFQFSRILNETKNQNKSPEGGMSRLARSVLINQTKSANKTDIARRRQLLDVARKFVSTPVNKKVTSTTTTNSDALRTTNLSPIVAPSRQKNGGGQSPWRVPDEAPLPNTFFFGINTSNLPSFSSDFIPGTPEQQTECATKRQSVLSDQTVIQHMDNVESNEQPDNQQPPRPLNSSIETNNSDAENVAPVLNTPNKVRLEARTPLKQNDNNNSSANQENENFIHLPNPRRALERRSPLKPINILEVITLPSWKNNITPVKEKQTPTQSVCSAAIANKNLHTLPKEQYFGFEDFLNNSIQNDSDDDIDNVACTRLNATRTRANKTLHEALQNLREIRPADEELPRPAVVTMGRIYEDINIPRQRNIRDMFCSTMINNRTLQTEADDSRDLFKDPDPETTFDSQKPHQTYVRPTKRKRKQRHQFVMFMDSDLSEEEEEDENDQDNYRAQKQKKKCTQKEEAQLKEFATSFNAMCREVDQFEIPVE